MSSFSAIATVNQLSRHHHDDYDLAKQQILQSLGSIDAIEIFDRSVLAERLVGVADRAQTAGALQAERAALDSLAKLHGFVVERRDTRVIRGFQDLTDEELRALIGEGHEG